MLSLRSGTGGVAAVAATVALAACAAQAAQVGHVGYARSHGSKITINPNGPCPTTLGDATDVTRSRLPKANELVPKDSAPTAGLICEYGEPPDATTGAVPPPTLTHAITLTQSQAQELAATISKISLTPPRGGFACPAQYFGSHTVIAFGYPDAAPTVDLWYETSGCRTLDNGHVSAFQGREPFLLFGV